MSTAEKRLFFVVNFVSVSQTIQQQSRMTDEL